MTAVTIAAQTVAVTPGGFGVVRGGSAPRRWSASGAGPGPAFAVALVTHAVKTAYSLVVGGVALVARPRATAAGSGWPRVLPPRPAAAADRRRTRRSSR